SAVGGARPPAGAAPCGGRGGRERGGGPGGELDPRPAALDLRPARLNAAHSVVRKRNGQVMKTTAFAFGRGNCQVRIRARIQPASAGSLVASLTVSADGTRPSSPICHFRTSLPTGTPPAATAAARQRPISGPRARTAA